MDIDFILIKTPSGREMMLNTKQIVSITPIRTLSGRDVTNICYDDGDGCTTIRSDAPIESFKIQLRYTEVFGGKEYDEF